MGIRIVVILLFLASAIGFADSDDPTPSRTAGDDALVAFAEMCRGVNLSSELPPGHYRRLISFAETIRGKYVMTDTPYISGAGHRQMDHYVGEEVGTIKRQIYLGEAEFDAHDKLVKIVDTSGFGHEMGISSNGQEFVRILKQVAPELIGPKPVEIYTHAQLQHLDPRLRSPITDNVRHDAIDPAVTAFMMQLDGYADNANARDQVAKEIKKLAPTLRLYGQLIEEEGKDPSQLTSFLDRLDRDARPSKEDAQALHVFLRTTRFWNRTEEENGALIHAREWPVPH